MKTIFVLTLLGTCHLIEFFLQESSHGPPKENKLSRSLALKLLFTTIIPAIAATAAPQLKFPQFNRRFQPSYSMIRCSRSCTQNYAPVCGYDNNPSFGEQFTNECFLQMYVCEDRGGQPFRDVLRGECFKPI
ncbi:hypothetical protein ACKWTF_014490 [Chironomus riparius]